MPNLYVIAGPNGAGKTTFAKEFLPIYVHCENFINADLIALGLAPFSPDKVQIKAGKLLLEQIHEYVKDGIDFAFESTLSGKAYISLLKKAKTKGFTITIFYLTIPSDSLAQERIKQRVKEGGHNVPIIDIKRRYKRSWENFAKLYSKIADSWYIFDNSAQPIEIAKSYHGDLKIINKHLYLQLLGNKK